MASVSFTIVWLNSASDLTDAMAFEVNDFSRAPAVSVSTSPFAGGTFRQVTTPGRQRSAQMTFAFATDAQIAWLEAHQGRVVCFRGPRGEKWYGSYNDVPAAPRPLPNSNSVQITITEITLSEVV